MQSVATERMRETLSKCHPYGARTAARTSARKRENGNDDTNDPTKNYSSALCRRLVHCRESASEPKIGTSLSVIAEWPLWQRVGGKSGMPHLIRFRRALVSPPPLQLSWQVRSNTVLVIVRQSSAAEYVVQRCCCDEACLARRLVLGFDCSPFRVCVSSVRS
jgi:hypothetical protein